MAIIKANQLSKNDYLALYVVSRKFAEEQFSPVIHYERLIKLYKDLINQ